VTEWSKNLVTYRLARADETLEDARILAKAKRWNACVNRLYYVFLSVMVCPLPSMRVSVDFSIRIT